MTSIDFWFDPISPYAYLAFERLPEAFVGLSYKVAYRPIVFGALLKAHDHKGPAEIEPKRAWTFRQVHWLAHRAGIAIDTPARHPFNSLAPVAARLGDRAGAGTPGRFACEQVLRHVWRGGADAEDPERARRARRATRATRRSGERRQQAAPARRHRRGPCARRVRRADDRHRRQALLGLRRARHGRRVMRGDPWFDAPHWQREGAPRPGVKRG